MFFTLAVSSDSKFWIRYDVSAPTTESYERFLREILEKEQHSILSSGRRAIIYFDQHNSFRSIAKSWANNNYFTFILSPKKCPWTNLCELAIGRIKMAIRRQDCRSKPQVLSVITEELRSWNQQTFSSLERSWICENYKLAQAFETHIK